MRALVRIEVNQCGRGFDRVEHRRHHNLRRRYETEHRPVVIGVTLDVQHLNRQHKLS